MNKQKRQQAAEAMRQQKRAEARKKKIVFSVAIGAAVLLIGGLLTLGIYLNRPTEWPVTEPEATTDDYAIVIGDGATEIDLYIDYLCPACKTFEDPNADQIQEWVDAGDVTVNYHIMNFLSNKQNDEYSTRAGAAAVAAADVGDDEFLEFTKQMYIDQPAETGASFPTNADIIAIGEGIGLDETWTDKVSNDTYMGWINNSQAAAADDDITGTPTVKINGTTLEDRSTFVDDVNAAITAAAGSTDDAAAETTDETTDDASADTDS